jgi:hypothetical protein
MSGIQCFHTFLALWHSKCSGLLVLVSCLFHKCLCCVFIICRKLKMCEVGITGLAHCLYQISHLISICLMVLKLKHVDRRIHKRMNSHLYNNLVCIMGWIHSKLKLMFVLLTALLILTWLCIFVFQEFW